MGMGMFMWVSVTYMYVHLNIMYVEARGQLWVLCLRSHFVHWDKISHWLGTHEVVRLVGFAWLCLPGITSTCHNTQIFKVGSRDQTRVLVPIKQALYTLSSLSSLCVDHHCMSNAICLQHETVLLGHISKSDSVDLERKRHMSSKEKGHAGVHILPQITHKVGSCLHSSN